MPEASYPSPEFPSPVSARLNYGEGWEPMFLPDALVAVGKATLAESGFRANVTVTSRRGSDLTLTAAAEATVQALVDSPDWSETGREFRTGSLGGFESFRIEGAFIHPQAGTLYQSAEIAVVQRGPFSDLVQVVGTCAAGEALEVLPDIRAIISSATLSEA